MERIEELIPAENRLGDWLASHERPTIECLGRSGLLPIAGAAQRLLDGGEPRDAVVGILIALADKLISTGNCRC